MRSSESMIFLVIGTLLFHFCLNIFVFDKFSQLGIPFPARDSLGIPFEFTKDPWEFPTDSLEIP